MTRRHLLQFVMLCILGLAGVAGLLFVPSVIVVKQLLVPLRMDSLFLSSKGNSQSENMLHPHLVYSPAQYSVPYVSFSIIARDGAVLRGWKIPAKEDNNGISILLLHDLGSSSISMLEAMKQFYDRGFEVFMMDLRAHGSSGGTVSSLGMLEQNDLSAVLDLMVNSDRTRDVAVLGLGLGGSVATLQASKDPRIKTLIVQSAFADLTSFVNDFASRKWGKFSTLLLPFFDMQLNYQLGFPSDSLNITRAAGQANTPSLFIAGEDDELIPWTETEKLYTACPAGKKEFWKIPHAGHYNISDVAGKTYYDKISVFILSNIERGANGNSRYKKLAFQD